GMRKGMAARMRKGMAARMSKGGAAAQGLRWVTVRGGSRAVDAASGATLAANHLPPAGRAHPRAESVLALALDPADAMRVMHGPYRLLSRPVAPGQRGSCARTLPDPTKSPDSIRAHQYRRPTPPRQAAAVPIRTRDTGQSRPGVAPANGRRCG